MTPEQPSVTVIVVTYNGSQWVNKCFSSLRKSIWPVSIIAVDNNSTDNTATLIRDNFPEVRLIMNRSNAGFGGANNQAIAVAIRENADFVFLLNQDAWIEPETINTLIEAFRNNNEYGIISPMHFNGQGDALDGAFRNYIEKEYDVNVLLNTLSKDVRSCRFINAAAWMVSRECLRKAGGFGYLFHQYGEDRDLVQRLNFYGLRLGFVTTTRIFHDRPAKRFDFSTVRKVTWYYTIGSCVRLADINRSFTSAWFGVLGWLMRDIAALVLKGRFSALPAFFMIFFSVFIGSVSGIKTYRSRIRSKTDFLFLTD